MQRVYAPRGLLYDEGVALVKVQPPQRGQRVRRGGEVKVELVVLGPLAACQALRAGGALLEGAQHHVVGHEVRVAPGDDGVYGERVYPECVLPHGGLHGGDDERVAEGQLLGALREVVVLVAVHQPVDAVFARRHATYGELPPAVGAPHAVEGQRGEGRVLQVGVQAHLYALHRLQVGGVEHRAAHHHRVYLRPGGEGEGKAIEGIALVVVLNSVGEVYGVRRVGLQRVFQCHLHPLAHGLNLGLLNLRRRDDHLLVGSLQHDVFVKFYADALALLVVVVQRARRRSALHKPGGRLVVRPALNATHAGTRPEHRRHQGNGRQSAHPAPPAAIWSFL